MWKDLNRFSCEVRVCSAGQFKEETLQYNPQTLFIWDNKGQHVLERPAGRFIHQTFCKSTCLWWICSPWLVLNLWVKAWRCQTYPHTAGSDPFCASLTHLLYFRGAVKPMASMNLVKAPTSSSECCCVSFTLDSWTTGTWQTSQTSSERRFFIRTSKAVWEQTVLLHDPVSIKLEYVNHISETVQNEWVWMGHDPTQRRI